jgi:hypothetical protein
VLVLADRPPCILATDPAAIPDARYILERAAGPRRLAVASVDDDLDPYPPIVDGALDLGEPEFRWQLATPASNDELIDVAGHAAPELQLDPAAFSPGDQVRVRVEIADRVDRTLPCADTAPTCAIAEPTCRQRVTWSVEIR